MSRILRHLAAPAAWPAPLYRQFLLLAWCAGILASRLFLPASTALGVLALFWLWRCQAREPKPAFRPLLPTLVLLAAAFVAGHLYANWRTPEKAPFPAWALQAATPPYQLPAAERGPVYSNGLRLSARVEEVSGLTDRRLRLILGNVRPLEGSGGQPPLPGRLVFAWQNPATFEAARMDDIVEGARTPTPPFFEPASFAERSDDRPAREPALPARPVPGQEVELNLKPRLVRSLANPGLWEIEAYWADQKVWHRAWAKGNSPDLRLASDLQPGPRLRLALWREELRRRVIRALPGVDVRPEKDASAGNGPGPARLLAPGADFIPALLFGDKFLMNSTDADLFSRATLSHSLALSGLHLGYAAALGYGFARLLFWFFPALAAHLPRRKFALGAALLPALFYTWLGGAPPSLLRSLLMLCFWGLLLYLKKPSVLWDGLLWAVGLILLFNPLAIFDLRLQLSALAVASIGLATPLLLRLCSRLEERLLPRRPGLVSRWAVRLLNASVLLLGTSLAVQLALMPLLVRNFGLYGLAFPLNLLWLPVLGLVVMPAAFFGLAASACGLEGAAALLFQLAAKPCALLLEILRQLDQAGAVPVILPSRPHWLFFVGYWLLLALIPFLAGRFALRWPGWLRLPGPTGSTDLAGPAGRSGPTGPVRTLGPFPAGSGSKSPAGSGGRRWPFVLAGLGLLLCLLPLALRHYETGREVVRLRLLDVGQGQAVLLEWPGGGRLLLDGGGGNSPRFDIGREIVAATLMDNRPARLDYLIASHPDQDHIGGLIFPLKHMDIGFFADNGQEPLPGKNRSYLALRGILEKRNIRRHSLYAGQTLQLAEGLRLEIVHPPRTAGPKFSDNNASLVARLVWQDYPLALLCGDAEAPAQRFLLQTLPAESLRAQVLILPHHGAAGASLDDFYAAVEPQLALAGCGYGNQWGFPSRRVRESLKRRNIELLDTAEQGQIIVEWNKNLQMSVRKTRDKELPKP